MLTRCRNKNVPCFRHYGGRGIKVCERWMNYENFLADMGPRPSPKHSIERVDNNRGYEPDNCIWATQSKQCKNRRKFPKKSDPDRAMCAAAGVNYDAWRWRVSHGMTPKEALAKPFIKKQWTRWLDQRATIAGRTLTMREWCQDRGIHPDTLRHRIKVGMPVDIALTRPLQQGWKGRFTT